MKVAIDILIDRWSDNPVYEQIAQIVREGIKAKTIQPGDRLPTERELAEIAGVARGTVTKAYSVLEKEGMIEVKRGAGCIILRPAEENSPSAPESSTDSRKDKAFADIARLIERLSSMRFSDGDIRSMLDLALREREERESNAAIAVVDCNPETLEMCRNQIAALSRANLSSFILSMIVADPNGERKLSAFDLIVTTATHHGDLKRRFPSLSERIIGVVAAPSRETILSIGSIGANARIGILCESARFFEIVKDRLIECRVGPKPSMLASVSSEEVESFLSCLEVLIVPGGGAIESSFPRHYTRFTERGGKILRFEYRFEKGSILHLEDRIRLLLEGKGP